MARHLFIGQQTLTTWLEQEKVDFDKNIMTIKADGRSFKLVEAVRFIKVEGGEEDRPGLLGRVKTNRQLESMGAERYRDSVIYKDIAYKVQEGFIGEVFLQQSPEAPDTAPVRPAAGPPPRISQKGRHEPAPAGSGSRQVPTRSDSPDKAAVREEAVDQAEEELTDEEMLARFLLENIQK